MGGEAESEAESEAGPRFYLVAATGQTRVPLGKDALHPEEEGALHLVLCTTAKRGSAQGAAHAHLHVHGHTVKKVGVTGRVGGQDGRHLVVVGRVDVLVDAVSCQLHLWDRTNGSASPWQRTHKDRGQGHLRQAQVDRRRF